MNTHRFRVTLVLVVLLALCAGLLLGSTPQVQATTPGSAADPLVTQLWLEHYLADMLAPVQTRLDGLSDRLGLGSKRIILAIGSTAATVNGQSETLSAAPQIMGGGYTMVPARFIGEALGLTVDWDPVTRIVSFQGAQGQMSLTIGSTTATINGETLEMPFAPVIDNGHTLVHVRFISESLRCTVDWEPSDRTVTIQK